MITKTFFWKTINILLFLFVHNNIALTQTEWECKTDDFFKDQQTHDCISGQCLGFTQDDLDVMEVKIIPIVLHLFYDATLEPPTVEEAKSAVHLANQQSRNNRENDQSDAKFEFRLATIDNYGNCVDEQGQHYDGIEYREIENATWGVSESAGRFEDTLDLSKWPIQNYLNVVVVPREGGGGQWNGNVITITYEVFEHTNNTDQTTFIHELGHALDLHHTFMSADWPDREDPCSETDPTTQGDCVWDTPPNLDNGISICLPTTSCGESAPFENFMSYCGDERSKFTLGQICRMHENAPPSFYSPENLANTGVISLEAGYTLSQSETWSNDKNINGDIIIPYAKTLTIDNGATIQFTTNSKIIVQKGGRLVINGTAQQIPILKGNSCSGNLWGGIQVEADALISHPENIADFQERNGVLEFRYGHIQDAEVAITSNGGAMHIANCTFANNIKGLDLNYLSTSSNASRIHNIEVQQTIFTTDDEYVGTTAPEYMYLSGVNLRTGDLPTERIRNCTFTDQRNGIDAANRAIGILTNKTEMVLGSEEHFNTFTNLYKGIEANNGIDLTRGLIISHNEFDNVFISITAQATNFVQIRHNSIRNIPNGSSLPDAPWGINVNNTPAVLIEENTLHKDGQTSTYAHGIIAVNLSESTGMEAAMYGNEFIGSFYAATYLEEDNSTLNLQCNKYFGLSKAD